MKNKHELLPELPYNVWKETGMKLLTLPAKIDTSFFPQLKPLYEIMNLLG